MAKKRKKAPSRGGARPGAGRPKKFANGTGIIGPASVPIELVEKVRREADKKFDGNLSAMVTEAIRQYFAR